MKRLLFLLSFVILAMNSVTDAVGAVYRHVVILKFKDDAPPVEVAKIEKAFVALKSKIDLIRDLEWGTNESPEGLDQGFTHVYFVSFESKAALEKYLPHPEHTTFVELLKTQIDKVLVVDYVPHAK